MAKRFKKWQSKEVFSSHNEIWWNRNLSEEFDFKELRWNLTTHLIRKNLNGILQNKRNFHVLGVGGGCDDDR
ncbi:hypothetical protein L6452_43216 [Arctium lappa]|uniref:Uncharacterized protein n=1 Tax=Arctium lappa TaxID=4217 RepID=A0ACB8XL00_ARCLA|nr:hypothetical protein L6452_43216 [Arctium lappa]